MAESIIENPTYLGNIRSFFDPVDLEHMAQLGVDLSTYEALKARATSVYFQTKPPDAAMPPDPERTWSLERSETFANWIRTGFPVGVPAPPATMPGTGTVERLRKDAGALDDDEIATLKNAFSGIMGRPVDDPEGYFVLAGVHWFPRPTECLHHEDRYNPWHRVYLGRFEDALRSVPGCESVTLPYWDITQPPPEFLFLPPFDSYTLPAEIHPNYPAGFVTKRFDRDRIVTEVEADGIAGIIDDALDEAHWGDFMSFTARGIEAAHDHGHGAIGQTMSKPDAAAFDPIFWFFHSNWDRLWWQWQQLVGATTVAGFRSTIMGSTAFLEAPFNDLPPFAATADQTVDLTAMRVGYGVPVGRGRQPSLRRGRSGSLRAAEGMRVQGDGQASVRLKGIDRLAIPGSFRAVLRADGEIVGRRTFFQSTEPMDCAGCREKAKINLDFLVDIDKIAGRTLSATIELVEPEREFPGTIPLSAAGDPTLNVRLLIERS